MKYKNRKKRSKYGSIIVKNRFKKNALYYHKRHKIFNYIKKMLNSVGLHHVYIDVIPAKIEFCDFDMEADSWYSSQLYINIKNLQLNRKQKRKLKLIEVLCESNEVCIHYDEDSFNKVKNKVNEDKYIWDILECSKDLRYIKIRSKDGVVRII